MPAKPTDSGIFVQSIYGAFERKPFVQITIRQEGEIRNLLLSPAEAREVAHHLFECAEAAEMDALVVKFLQNRVGLPLEQSAEVLMDLRRLREGE